MGAGASLLAGDAALHDALAAAGWAPTVQRVSGPDPGAPEVARTFDVLRQLAADVRGAVARGAFPLVLAGGCLSAVATVAGAVPAGAGAGGELGVVWLDAHADLDTPEDNVSGFLDVMALSMLAGRCWAAQRRSIDGVRAVPEEHVALLGVRDLAPHQAERAERSAVRRAPGAFDPAAARAAIAGLPRTLYLHVDLDVLDTAVGRANHYAAPGGPSLATVLATVDAAFEHGRVVAAALSAYDPTADRDSAILAAAQQIAARIAARAAAQRG